MSIWPPPQLLMSLVSSANREPPLKRVRYIDSESSFSTFINERSVRLGHSNLDEGYRDYTPSKSSISANYECATPAKLSGSANYRSHTLSTAIRASTPSNSRLATEEQAARELEQQREASRQRVLSVWESLEQRYIISSVLLYELNTG